MSSSPTSLISSSQPPNSFHNTQAISTIDVSKYRLIGTAPTGNYKYLLIVPVVGWIAYLVLWKLFDNSCIAANKLLVNAVTIHKLDQAIGQVPSLIQGRYHLEKGKLLLMEGRNQEAIAALEQAEKEIGNLSPELWYLKANAFAGKHQFTEASGSYTRAINLCEEQGIIGTELSNQCRSEQMQILEFHLKLNKENISTFTPDELVVVLEQFPGHELRTECVRILSKLCCYAFGERLARHGFEGCINAWLINIGKGASDTDYWHPGADSCWSDTNDYYKRAVELAKEDSSGTRFLELVGRLKKEMNRVHEITVRIEEQRARAGVAFALSGNRGKKGYENRYRPQEPVDSHQESFREELERLYTLAGSKRPAIS